MVGVGCKCARTLLFCTKKKMELGQIGDNYPGRHFQKNILMQMEFGADASKRITFK